MSDKLYTMKTAALKATKADIRNLDAKQIKLKDKNILDYIKESEFNSYDTRDPQLKNDELDIWNTAISLSEEGHIEVKPQVHSVDNGIQNNFEGITQSQVNTLRTAVKIIDNKVLDANDEHIMYWQTNGLTKGEYMFNSCPNLTTFTSDLSSLTEGHSMFYQCENLTSFSSDLSSLTTGWEMFTGCTNLTLFSSDLSNLTNGEYMFWECSALTSFSSDLSSLTNGNSMFGICKLDAPSVANIIHFIPQRDAKPINEYADGNILIGIGIPNTDAAKQAFAEELNCDTWEELNQEFDDKNWAVTWQFNGEAVTYDLRNPRPSTVVYTKLEEVIMPTEEEIKEAKKNKRHVHIPHYQYTSQDGSKFYNIHWYHNSNTNNEGFDCFESLEDAILSYNLKHKD